MREASYLFWKSSSLRFVYAVYVAKRITHVPLRYGLSIFAPYLLQHRIAINAPCMGLVSIIKLSSVKCKSYVCLYCFFYLSNFQEKCTFTTFPLGLSINPLWSHLDILLYFIRFFWIFWDIVFIFIYIVYISICLSQIYFEIIFCQCDQYNFLLCYITLWQYPPIRNINIYLFIIDK